MLISLIFLLLIIHIIGNSGFQQSLNNSSLRAIVLKTYLIYALVVYSMIELSSAFNKLNHSTFVSAHLIMSASMLCYIIYHKYFDFTYITQRIPLLKKLSTKEKLYLGCFMLLGVLPLLLLAVYSAPNNFDSLNYHLARISQWIQNANVEHFPTNHTQQLYHNIFAEYLQMNLMLLDNNDHFVNLVQFAAMIGALITTSAFLKELNVSYKLQIVATSIVFAIPIGILESTTTQNDYLSAFFLCSFVFWGYRFSKNVHLEDALYMTISVFLGGFTKYPCFFYAFPFAIYFFFQGFLKLSDIRSKGLLAFFALFLGIFIFSPFFLRNFHLFHSILSPAKTSAIYAENLMSERIGIKEICITTLRNLAINLGLPSNTFNQKVTAFVEYISFSLGLKKQDYAILSLGTYRGVTCMINEDMSGNFLHLIFVSLGFLSISLKGERFERLFTLCLIVGFILSSTFLKWQEFSGRTQLGFFILGTIIVIYHFQKIKLSSYILKSVTGVFILGAIPFIYSNPSKSLVPFTYIVKKIIKQAPLYLAVKSGEEKAHLAASPLHDYYDFTSMYPALKSGVSHDNEITIFNTLDSLGYFDYSIKHPFFYKSRDEQFFTMHGGHNEFLDFKKLTNKIPLETQNIALLFQHTIGFYHYWSILNTRADHPVYLKHIYFSRDYLVLKNAKVSFSYNYILCDNLQVLHNHIPSAAIESIDTFGELSLIKLKKASNAIYTLEQ